MWRARKLDQVTIKANEHCGTCFKKYLAVIQWERRFVFDIQLNASKGNHLTTPESRVLALGIRFGKQKLGNGEGMICILAVPGHF